MSKRLTQEQRQLKSELKRINTRIATLYKEGKKAHDMSVYYKYIEGFNTREFIDTHLLHESRSGALQLSQNPRFYEGKTEKALLRVGRYVPTITELKTHVKKENPEQSYDSIDFFDVIEHVETMDKLSTEFKHKYDELLEKIDDDAVISEYIPEMWGKGSRKDISFQQLVDKMDGLIRKHDNGELPL